MTDRPDPVLEAWRSGDEERFIRELSRANIESAYRPRDEFDVDVDPKSLRGQILATRDAYEAMPRWLRFTARILSKIRELG
jgi:hypothetical protein